MGGLRIGCALFVGLFATVILVFVGTVFGVLATAFLAGTDAPLPTDFAAPLDLLSINAPGAWLGGGIGALLGITIGFFVVKRASDINWLKSNGQRIYATVTKIEQHRRSRTVHTGGDASHSHTEWYTVYKVVALWTDPATRITHTFSSDDLTSYPRRLTPNGPVEVLIDPNNLKRYFMEV